MTVDRAEEVETITFKRRYILMRGKEFVGMDTGYPWFTASFDQAHKFGRVEDLVAWTRTFQDQLAGCRALSFDRIDIPHEPIPVQDLIDREDEFERERAELYARYGKSSS